MGKDVKKSKATIPAIVIYFWFALVALANLINRIDFFFRQIFQSRKICLKKKSIELKSNLKVQL